MMAFKLIGSAVHLHPRIGSWATFRRRSLTSVAGVNIVRGMSMNNITTHVERVNGHMTEFIEYCVENPKLRIVFIPGNPGIVSFYQSYIEELAQHFDGEANITAISHVGHTSVDWHNGKLFSLEDQIEHKIYFLQNQDSKIPLYLVGHSIGAYIALCIFKQLPEKVRYVVGLYPFLAINTKSTFQSLLRWSVRHNILQEALSHFALFVGKLPEAMSRSLFKNLMGKRWSPVSVNVACQYLLQYSVVRNFTYMGMTEFKKLTAHPDWAFLKEKCNLVCLLFGVTDHWGPLQLFHDITEQVPALVVDIDKDGYEHAFCCTEAGSRGVAAYCATAIKKVHSL